MFSIQKEMDEEFLRVKTEGGCTSIGKKHNFSVEHYPFLSWKWRVHQLPSGGDETKKNKNDSGAGVYVIFKGKFKSNNIIKYVWSSTLPPGTIINSPITAECVYGFKKRYRKKRTMDYPKSKYKGRLSGLFGKKPPEVEVIGLLRCR
jgi:hypothetical protein